MDEKQIECGGFTFLSNFDSANLSRVELVPRKPGELSVDLPHFDAHRFPTQPLHDLVECC